jgi:hypothetical protein
MEEAGRVLEMGTGTPEGCPLPWVSEKRIMKGVR